MEPVSEAAEFAFEFERHRGHLRAVATRILGSPADAEDAVQEAWLRASRAGTDGIENVRGWLTTITARICLNTLQSRGSRREHPLDEALDAPEATSDDRTGPATQAELADAVAPALLLVLDTLAPAERLAFVLHDVFAVPFDEIAGVLDKSPAATRQLASRARRRVQGADAPQDRARAREVVAAFLAAARDGDFDRLLTLLDPDAVALADATAVSFGAQPVYAGADAVAGRFVQARGARDALVDGVPGGAWVVDGTPRVVFEFVVVDGRIRAAELIGDPGTIAAMEVTLLD